MRLPDVPIDTGRHAAQRIDGTQRDRVADGESHHRRPGRGGTQHEMGGGGLPDPAAVAQESRELGLGARTESRPDPGQGVLRVVRHLDHAAVGVAIAESRIQPAQSDPLVQPEPGALEESGENLRQRQDARSGVDHDTVDLDGAGLPARTGAGFDDAHRKAAPRQGKCGGQAADARADDENLVAAVSRHRISYAAGSRAVARPARADSTYAPGAPAGRTPAADRRDGFGRGGRP